MEWETTTVLVTGGTRGIGRAVVEMFRSKGCRVMMTGTRPDFAATGDVEYYPIDFCDTEKVETFLETVKNREIDILVNNAGINKVMPLEQYPCGEFEKIIRVNMLAPFQLCQAVIPNMRKKKFGRIVNVTSIFSVVSKAGRAPYSASKSGLVGMTRALALEVAQDNILVNCLAPGFVDTDLTRQVLGECGIEEIKKKIPLGRMTSPGEIAKYVCFLASPENTYMTGQNIVVDGGYTCE